MKTKKLKTVYFTDEELEFIRRIMEIEHGWCESSSAIYSPDEVHVIESIINKLQ